MTIPPVGPERDRAVAEMLGRKAFITLDTDEPGIAVYSHTFEPVPSYSTSPAAAFEALETWVGQQAEREYDVYRSDVWGVSLFWNNELIGACSNAPTFPDAATAALLRAGGNP